LGGVSNALFAAELNRLAEGARCSSDGGKAVLLALAELMLALMLRSPFLAFGQSDGISRPAYCSSLAGQWLVADASCCLKMCV
jgi:hypothetical protein